MDWQRGFYDPAAPFARERGDALIGRVLAAQFGYLPGALWILIGAVFAGAVQDFAALVAAMACLAVVVLADSAFRWFKLAAAAPAGAVESDVV